MQKTFFSHKISKFSTLLLATMLVFLTGCGSGAPTGTPAAASGVGATATITSLQLSASPTTVKSDNSNLTTVTVTALGAGNVAFSGAVVALGTSTGVLSSGSVTTGSTGTATVTFSSGTASKFNRTATITATAGTATTTLPIPITGSTLTLTTPSSSISTGTPAALTITAKDAAGNGVSGQTVSFTIVSGSGTLSVATATTNSSGIATVNFTATATGVASVRADWLDSPTGTATASATQAFSAASAGAAFQLITPASSPFAVTLGTPQAVTIYVPATILTSSVVNVRFTTSLGSWLSTSAKSATIAFTGAGNYTQTFMPGPNAGNANVQIDALDTNGAILTSAQTVLSLSATAASATQISLSANVTSISPSTGSTSSTATLTAMVRDASNNPVGNAPVLFELVNPTGGGEQVTPVTVMTAATATSGVSVGQAQSTFIAGTLPTTQASQIKASVIGSAVSAVTAITVGGTAGSIAIGTSSTIASVLTDTAYQLPVSLLVTDSNGSAVSGAVVSLSLWPSSYRKGVRGLLCAPIYDGPSAGVAYAYANEDIDENLILGPTEDVDGPGGHNAGIPFIGPKDNALWPPSSSAGSVPQTVTTGSDGSASFNLTYLKEYANWVKIRLRARTRVQGTEATSVYNLLLPISAADSKDPCSLSNSPFN